MAPLKAPAIGLLIALAVCGLPACGSRTAPPSPAIDRVDQIVKRSGGDWNKVSPQDQQYMIQTVGKGSPISARMTFDARAGHLAPAKGVRH